MKRSDLLSLFCLMWIPLFINACGFRPRLHDPLSHQAIHIQANDALSSCIKTAIEKKISKSSSEQPPLFSIILSNAQMNTIPISLNSYHQVYQQELQLTLSYQVDKNNTEWIPPQRLEVHGEQRISHNSPFSDEAESTQLHQRLCDRAAQKLLLQMGEYEQSVMDSP